MEKFLISIGALSCIIVISCIGLFIFEVVTHIIKRIYESRGKATIKAGTILFNHDKGIKITLKKDIEIKFKKEKVMRAETSDNRLYGVSWGIHKKHAQSELERRIVDAIYQDSKQNRKSVLMTEYVRDIKKLNN